MLGWAEKPRGQVGFSRLPQRVLYTTRHELLTNYWVSMNDYKLSCCVSINSTSYYAEWGHIISADICWHVNPMIELCWLRPNTACNHYYPQCSIPFYHILTNQCMHGKRLVMYIPGLGLCGTLGTDLRGVVPHYPPKPLLVYPIPRY